GVRCRRRLRVQRAGLAAPQPVQPAGRGLRGGHQQERLPLHARRAALGDADRQFPLLTEPATMLLHIPGVLDRKRLAKVRSALDGAEWVDGRQTVGAQGAQVKRNLQLAEDSPLRRELGAIVLDALGRSPLFFAAALPLRILPPRFNRYEGGGTYGAHVDGA